MTIQEYVLVLGQQAKAAAEEMSTASASQKNQALQAIAEAIEASRAELIAANKKDLVAGKENGLDSAMLDRLELTEARIDTMIEGLHQVTGLPDPIGAITDLVTRPSGIDVGRMRVPLGVIGIIYESRPNVTIEAASLCLKTGNATILRGGSEALHANQALAQCIQKGLSVAGLPAAAVQIVNTTDRAVVGELITLSDYVDVIVPRGGKGLIERISRDAKVPVIKHLDGICHTFIDSDADLEKAHNIAMNAKTHRYGTCNTMETLLVAESVAGDVLPSLAKALQNAGVELRVCPQARDLLAQSASFGDEAVSLLVAASDEDWGTEYLAAILSIKIVADMEAAIQHINTYSSQHTDVIVTENYTKARRFLRAVDSSSVMVNASSRFADGFEYGLGAEIGISTDKLHARGPVGLEGLTSQKYIVLGDGHIRQ